MGRYLFLLTGYRSISFYALSLPLYWREGSALLLHGVIDANYWSFICNTAANLLEMVRREDGLIINKSHH